MNKKKLIKLRCKAWGITEDEYYCNQCSDFSLEDMTRAYRRGKNKGRAELEKQIAELKVENAFCEKACEGAIMLYEHLTKAKEKIRDLLEIIKRPYQFTAPRKIQMINEAEQLMNEVEK